MATTTTTRLGNGLVMVWTRTSSLTSLILQLLLKYSLLLLPRRRNLAVYLVAQYARYEMRKMEAELELKKKAEEEQKANEMERIAAEEKEKEESDPKLLEVKVRLDKLEETVKEIVVYSKKQPDSTTTKRQEEDTEEKRIAATEPINSESSSKAGNAATKDNLSKQSSAEVTPGSGQERDRKLERVTDASQQDQKGISQNGEGHSRDPKR